MQRDVLLFANSIGVKADDLHFLYVSANNISSLLMYSLTADNCGFGCRNCTHISVSFQRTLLSFVCLLLDRSVSVAGLLTYPAFKLTDQEVIEFYARNAPKAIPGAHKLDLRYAVDGQRNLKILKPLPTTSAGRRFELRNRLIGVYDKGASGSSLETEQRIIDADSGEVYAQTLSVSFLPGQGNWGGPRGKHSGSLQDQSLSYIARCDAEYSANVKVHVRRRVQSRIAALMPDTYRVRQTRPFFCIGKHFLTYCLGPYKSDRT